MTRSIDSVLRLTAIGLAVGMLLVWAPTAQAQLVEPGCLSGNDPVLKGLCTVAAGLNITKNTITIQGQKGALKFLDGAGVTRLKVNSIFVESGGTLQAGDATNPIGKVLGSDNKPSGGLVITFTGAPGGPQCTADWCGKGIYVKKGGSLLLYGAKGVPANGVSWTYLSAAAGPAVAGAKVQSQGASALTLASSVSANNAAAWRAGDWIAVATTSFSPFETEFVQLSEDPVGTSAKLSQALRHYHFGSLDPGPPSAANYLADKTKNYGVDERAEVGLISRSIKLTAEVASDSNWGGEIKLVGFDTKAKNVIAIQGVELEKFGKARLGSYPIHAHMIGDVPTGALIINANSIHHSYNKCITIHSTSNVTIENNVCARIAGHIFYQEVGDEFDITFRKNLGLGAMSHNFDIAASTSAEKRATYWGGDNLANLAASPGVPDPAYGYSGLNIPNTDSQSNPVRGTCAVLSATGELAALADHTPRLGHFAGKDCPATDDRPPNVGKPLYYYEPPTGFWIINPTTVLDGNSIGGCQGVGRGYWYVVPKNLPEFSDALRALQRIKIATAATAPKRGVFINNRVHGCFSGLYAESEYEVLSDQLLPTIDGQPGTKSVFNLFEGFTATRIRQRGVWIRPSWSVLRHGRFATNKASVILVSSGGLDGNAPGFWALLEQSVLVGISENNVDRWGPCPANAAKGVGCIDLTTAAKDIVADGYPLPAFTLLGYQIYDGPVRILKNRFVNFKKGDEVPADLTDADKTFLASFTAFFPRPPKTQGHYEGDAALGWFQANQSGYPNATISHELTFENVTLRHQVFTEGVNYGEFQDGDRNTVIIDGDGSLSGLHVVDGQNKVVLGAVSLNNLGFNQAGANSVDECLAEGQQDADVEARPTALMSPQGVATLEFQAAWPPSTATPPNPAAPGQKQRLTFAKDNKDFCGSGEPCVRETMALTSRNQLGVWEPKVVSGYGYTVTASPCSNPPDCTAGDSGIPKRVSLGLTDAIKPVISAADPFKVRVGLCYTGNDGFTHPNGDFTITRGYRSWGPGAGVEPNDIDLQQFFNNLVVRYPKGDTQTCHNLDTQDCIRLGSPDRIECKNLDPVKGCPANGVTPIPTGADTNVNNGCPAGTTFVKQDQQDRPACIYPKTTLTQLTCATGTPGDCLKKLTDKQYFYDKASGMLYFYVIQDAPNAVGPSPLGSCPVSGPKDPACPDVKSESFYACPAQGCIDYVVQLNDASYIPGKSNCTPYEQFAQTEPVSPYRLVVKEGNTLIEVKRVFDGGKNGAFPHYKAVRADNDQPLVCTPTATPDAAADGD